MKKHTLILSSLLINSVTLQAAVLPKFPVQAYDCDSCESLSHASLMARWPIKNMSSVQETLHEQSSKTYTINTTLKQLRQGVIVKTRAPEAVIRITPTHKTNHNTPAFFLTSNNQTTQPLVNASSDYFDETKANNQILLKLKPELGSGIFKLLAQTKDSNNDTEPYTIYVLDQGANPYLTVRTDKAHYFYGDDLIATIILSDHESDYSIQSLYVTLISPEGTRIPLDMVQASPEVPNVFKASTELLTKKSYQGENWYLETEVTSTDGTRTLKRQAHTAFSYSVPSAAIREIKTQSSKLLNFSATLEVATASRYALQAVLFKEQNGKKIPVETVQAANWLEVGKQIINFSFTPTLTKNYNGRYYLGALTIMDYGQLKPVFEYNDFIQPIADG